MMIVVCLQVQRLQLQQVRRATREAVGCGGSQARKRQGQQLLHKKHNITAFLPNDFSIPNASGGAGERERIRESPAERPTSQEPRACGKGKLCTLLVLVCHRFLTSLLLFVLRGPSQYEELKAQVESGVALSKPVDLSVVGESIRLGGSLVELKRASLRIGFHVIFNDFNFTLGAGDTIGVVGDNGAG